MSRSYAIFEGRNYRFIFRIVRDIFVHRIKHKFSEYRINSRYEVFRRELSLNRFDVVVFHERSRIRLVANSTDWPDRGRRGKMTNRGGANSIFGKLSAECRVTRCSWSILPSPRLITLYRVASWRKRREISVLLQPFASNAFGIRCGIRAGIDSPAVEL